MNGRSKRKERRIRGIEKIGKEEGKEKKRGRSKKEEIRYGEEGEGKEEEKG